jgi:hypothetical protein
MKAFSRERANFRLRTKKQFERAELNGQIPPLFMSLGFSLERRKEERKEGRLVVPARNLQLLVGTTFFICRVIPKAFLLAPFTLLYPEQMLKIPASLQVMNK